MLLQMRGNDPHRVFGDDAFDTRGFTDDRQFNVGKQPILGLTGVPDPEIDQLPVVALAEQSRSLAEAINLSNPFDQCPD